MKELELPQCMMPDGAEPCIGYSELYEKNIVLQEVIQMCFEDACSPTGKIKKKTAIKLMQLTQG